MRSRSRSLMLITLAIGAACSGNQRDVGGAQKDAAPLDGAVMAMGGSGGSTTATTGSTGGSTPSSLGGTISTGAPASSSNTTASDAGVRDGNAPDQALDVSQSPNDTRDGGRADAFVRGEDTSDASECRCDEGRMSLACYCAHLAINGRGHECERTFAGFGANPAGYFQIEEYANCNLVVESHMGIIRSIDVYDLKTGKLVGTLHQSDYRSERCPYPGYPDDMLLTIWAGRFPDSSCVRSRCLTGQEMPVDGITPCGDGGI